MIVYLFLLFNRIRVYVYKQTLVNFRSNHQGRREDLSIDLLRFQRFFSICRGQTVKEENRPLNIVSIRYE